MRADCVTAIVSALITVALAGCSSSPASLTGPPGETGVAFADVTSYGPSNAIITTGFSERDLRPDHVEVRVKGSSVTPRERLEKLAMARAAELGIEQKRKYFRPGSPVHSVICIPARAKTGKGGDVAADRAPLLLMEVVYAKVPGEGFIPSKETFERLTTEMSQETFSPESKAATAQAVVAKCGA